ncbi:MAG: transcription antitermination factor NusB [Thermoanaerobaculia bacterium]|nr:transcription antitermination factor NusB [Thermoanaerobaculia bacterium]
MGARRKARELALQMLFQHDVAGNEPDDIIETFEDIQRVRPNIREFAIRVFRGTLEKQDDIDKIVVEQADNWRLSRMPVVDRNLIRMAIYEMMYLDETPKLVILDEAIEIAKRFGTEKSSQFINGILDGVLKRYNLV